MKDWKRKWKLQLIESTKFKLGGFVPFYYLTGFQLRDCRNDAVDVGLYFEKYKSLMKQVLARGATFSIAKGGRGFQPRFRGRMPLPQEKT